MSAVSAAIHFRVERSDHDYWSVGERFAGQPGAKKRVKRRFEERKDANIEKDMGHSMKDKDSAKCEFASPPPNAALHRS